MQQTKRYTTGEEIANAVTHGIGAGLSAAAIPLLVVHGVRSGCPARTLVGLCVFGAMLFFLYMMSTLYHSLVPFAAKEVFGRLDHASIYALIAGTYTPYCFAALSGAFGWVVFGIIWGFAALGITMYAVFGSRMRKLSALSYVPMAWIIIFAWKRLAASVPAETTRFLLAGGICYTVGAAFYALKKIKWMHTVFHVFCVAGSVCHFFSVWFMV